MHSSYPCGLVLQEVARSGAGVVSGAQKTWELVSVMPCSVALVRDFPLSLWGQSQLSDILSVFQRESCESMMEFVQKKGGGGLWSINFGEAHVEGSGPEWQGFLEPGCAGVCCKSLGALNPVGSISIWPHAGLKLHYLEHIGTSWTRPVVATEFPRPWTELSGEEVPALFSTSRNPQNTGKEKSRVHINWCKIKLPKFIHDKNSAW